MNIPSASVNEKRKREEESWKWEERQTHCRNGASLKPSLSKWQAAVQEACCKSDWARAGAGAGANWRRGGRLRLNKFVAPLGTDCCLLACPLMSSLSALLFLITVSWQRQSCHPVAAAAAAQRRRQTKNGETKKNFASFVDVLRIYFGLIFREKNSFTSGVCQLQYNI